MARGISRQNRKNAAPITGKPEAQLNRVEVFKKMCRMLEMKRKRFLEDDWRHYAKLIPQQQFIHLMMGAAVSAVQSRTDHAADGAYFCGCFHFRG